MTEIAKQPGTNQNELAEKKAISLRTISRMLQNLSSDSLGLIEYRGSKNRRICFDRKGKNYLETLE